MRLTEFAYGIIERFAPMSEKSANELKSDAMIWYSQKEKEMMQAEELNTRITYINEQQDNPDLTDDEKLALLDTMPETPKIGVQHKIVKFAESWMARTLFAILFIWITPKIQEYLNPKKQDDGFDDFEEEEDYDD